MSCQLHPLRSERIIDTLLKTLYEPLARDGPQREPVWVDRYVLACAGQLRRLADLEPFLVQVLEPALLPAATAHWQGPFQVGVLDGRRLLDEFLPGEMHLAAPAVLCVHDRRLAG